MRAKHLLSCILFFTFAVVLAQDASQPLAGKVVSIADGDTLTLLVGTTQHRIRLNGIDAPESTQAFGTKSKQAIADKVFGKDVTVKWATRDKYKRILGDVYLGDRWINHEMVAEGYAWHYIQYSTDAKLAAAEKQAKEKKVGLWADAKPIPPWEFRRGKADPDADPDSVFVTASGKKYHRDGCKFIAKSKIPIALKDAQAKYEPCSVCKPPTK